MNDFTERQLEKLLNAIPADKEAPIQTSLFNVLDELDKDNWELQKNNKTGPCDLFSYSNKTIIETKARNKLNEVVDKDQVLRYLRDAFLKYPPPF